jgi:type IV secretion system protein VirB10
MAEQHDDPRDDDGEPSPPRPRRGPARDATPVAEDIDRGAIGPVGGSHAMVMRGGAFAAVAAVILVFFVTQSGGGRNEARTAAERRAAEKPVKTVVDYNAVAAKPPPRLAQAASDPGAPVLNEGTDMAPGPGGQLVPAIGTGGAAPSAPKKSPEETLADTARRSPLMAFGASHAGSLADQAGGAGELGSPAGTEPASHDSAGDKAPSELQRLTRAEAIRQSRARMIGDRDYLITAGTIIPCVLQTAMHSGQPGYTTCLVPRDVYSDNGRVILLEKGTKVLGEYQGGLNQGQGRLFVLWTRAITPEGVSIDLGSPGSDALGRAGFAGAVDTFFWARFGSALLLSLIDDGMQVAGSALQNRGTYSTQVPGQTAGIALQNSVNIRPVLRKNQGEEVGIFVAQDFDFGDVYTLELKR